MTDHNFIQFLWHLLWDCITGRSPSEEGYETLRTELNERGIVEGDFPA
jgi:hypothetical protein